MTGVQASCECILILAPIGRDAAVAAGILDRAGIASIICGDLQEVVTRLDQASSAVITDEALQRADCRVLAEWISSQPPWSDFPFILLTQRGGVSDPLLMDLLGNVTPVERPFHPSTLVSAARAALRARKRQREAEAYLVEREQTEHRQKLLIRELHHRVKNTLATVQAVVGATARTATSIEEFYQAFTGRIVSLANTHMLLTEALWQTASLHDMVEMELGPYRDDNEERVRISGPAIDLPSEMAVPMGMVLHELATNAVKYGSLSAPSGRLEVAWTLTSDGAGPKLEFFWRESGGPEVRPPQRRGFGSQLIQRVLGTQLGAQVRSDFAAAGLVFHAVLPLPATLKAAAADEEAGLTLPDRPPSRAVAADDEAERTEVGEDA